MEFLQNMLQRDRDNFKRLCNKLLSVCFICKSSSSERSEREDYYFILRHKEVFTEYLGLLGNRLEINEEYGVIQLTNAQDYNRQHLKLFESIILLVLRVLFDEKKRQLSISDEVIINLGDIQDKFLSIKIREKMIDKTTMRNTLNLFRRFHLIETLDKDLNNEESRVLIYDSILMAVRVEDIKQAYEKLEKYRKGEREHEEIDEDEID